ncbi:MAG: hypothetical protein K2X03_19430 [Bryobacteraceae bacterium]|nr:hypothetical protein [Bryobacteraceae bacterium]
MRFLLCVCALALAQAKDVTVQVLGKDGQVREVATGLRAITVDGRAIPLARILSVHSGEPASASEATRIEQALPLLAAADQKTSDRAQRDAATAGLVAIGLPVMTPLLKAYKDTDQHEPRPLYRLFERIIPSAADGLDRSLSLIRLTNGEMLRGKVQAFDEGGLQWANIRRLAVRQRQVSRRVSVHSILHATRIEWFDTGVSVSASSKVDSKASGFTRLSWETDGWATDPDGLQKPGPNYKTNLVDGQPFGALVGRIDAGGSFLLGKSAVKQGLAAGRLMLAINDNAHWQNNLGRYQVTLSVTEAYDLGEPQ